MLISTVVANLSQSFLQGNEEPLLNISQLSEPDYDLFAYINDMSGVTPDWLKNYQPEGENTPENDFLFAKYINIITEIYAEYAPSIANSTTGNSTTTTAKNTD